MCTYIFFSDERNVMAAFKCLCGEYLLLPKNGDIVCWFCQNEYSNGVLVTALSYEPQQSSLVIKSQPNPFSIVKIKIVWNKNYYENNIFFVYCFFYSECICVSFSALLPETAGKPCLVVTCLRHSFSLVRHNSAIACQRGNSIAVVPGRWSIPWQTSKCVSATSLARF